MKTLIIKQESKKLYGASFNIYSKNGEILGQITVEGGQVHLHVNVSGTYQGHTFSYKHRNGLKEIFDVQIDNQNGIMYRAYEKLKKGLFATKYCKSVVEINNNIYERWIVGVGEKGYVHTLYLNGTPVAHAVKPCVVLNDMHEYTVTIYNEENIEHTLVMFLEIIFHFTWSSYNPSQVVKSGKSKSISINKDKNILEKIAYLKDNF